MIIRSVIEGVCMWKEIRMFDTPVVRMQIGSGSFHLGEASYHLLY